jgi:hypothetical protein
MSSRTVVTKARHYPAMGVPGFRPRAILAILFGLIIALNPQRRE